MLNIQNYKAIQKPERHPRDLSPNDRSTYIVKTIQVPIEAFRQLLKRSKALRSFGRQSKDKKSLHTLKHPTVTSRLF